MFCRNSDGYWGANFFATWLQLHLNFPQLSNKENYKFTVHFFGDGSQSSSVIWGIRMSLQAMLLSSKCFGYLSLLKGCCRCFRSIHSQVVSPRYLKRFTSKDIAKSVSVSDMSVRLCLSSSKFSWISSSDDHGQRWAGPIHGIHSKFMILDKTAGDFSRYLISSVILIQFISNRDSFWPVRSR